MNSYTLGSVIRLSATVKNLAGALTDAATVTVTIKPPSGATIVSTGPVHDGTGLYHYDYEPLVSLTHNIRIATTNPDAAIESQVYVIPSII